MRVNWKELFTAINVDWRDRGKNTSRNNVNICCPYCADDPSFHMRVSEQDDAYHCLRDPRHSGRDTTRLLVTLGVRRDEAVGLLSDFRAGASIPKPPKATHTPMDTTWQKFDHAVKYDLALDYLWKRGFDDPELTCQRYDLRMAPVGLWAKRLLLPFVEKEHVVSWSGRALRASLEPKYLMADLDLADLLYIPRAPRETLIITEGQFDALKIAVATENENYASVALVGKSLSGGKLLRLQELAQTCRRVLLILDANVPVSFSHAMLDLLASSLRHCYARRLRVPSPFEDPADVPMGDIMPWLSTETMPL